MRGYWCASEGDVLGAPPPKQTGACSVFRGSKEAMYNLHGVVDHGGGPSAQERAWVFPRGEGDRLTNQEKRAFTASSQAVLTHWRHHQRQIRRYLYIHTYILLSRESHYLTC